MTIKVPSLEAQLYLQDPQTIIEYTLRKYQRTPKDAVPLLGDAIISLAWRVANLAKNPDELTSSISSDLQNTYNRIFNGERTVKVSTIHTPNGATGYDITISILYTVSGQEVSQTGMTIPVIDGELVIPEDTIRTTFA